jgi:hypothetical protein
MTREEYLTKIRALYVAADCYVEDHDKEEDYVSDLAEDGWPDHCKWLIIWNRLHDGGELTPRERECAVAQFQSGEDFPPDDLRLP